MIDVILVGQQHNIIELPATKWIEHLSHAQQHPSQRLDFMTPNHYRVRNFAVLELPRNGEKPLSAEHIAERLQLSPAAVKTLLADLEKHLFFLALNTAGDVTWAYPVTAEKTPHRLRFSTGEQTYAA